MKKLLLSLIILSLVMFVSCKNIPSQEKLPELETCVAAALMDMDENYSDETLKAMSIVVRTNLLITPENKPNFKANDKYLKLASATAGLVLKNKADNLVELGFENNDSYTWQKSIKKSQLLEFALKNNISLTSLTKINPVINNGKVVSLEVGGKSFDYDSLAQEFDLESNIIDNISQTKTELIINGKSKGFYGYFDVKNSEQLSNNNYFFEDILGYFFENLKVIKN